MKNFFRGIFNWLAKKFKHSELRGKLPAIGLSQEYYENFEVSEEDRAQMDEINRHKVVRTNTPIGFILKTKQNEKL